MAGLKTARPEIVERPLVRPVDSDRASGSWIVTVYDNDFNTYDEVIEILMIATACPFDEAQIEAWEIDHLGKSVVHCAPRDVCEQVSEVIAQIGIEVRVSKE